MPSSKNKKGSSPVSKKVKIKRTDLQELHASWLRCRYFIQRIENFLRDDFFTEVFCIDYDFNDPECLNEIWQDVEANHYYHDYVNLLRVLYTHKNDFIQSRLRAEVEAELAERRLRAVTNEALGWGHKCCGG